MPRVAIVASSAARRDALRARVASADVDVVTASATVEEVADAHPDVLVVVGRDLFAHAIDWAADDEHAAVVGVVSDAGALTDVRAAAASSLAQAGTLRGWALVPETASSRELLAAIAAADAGLASWPVAWSQGLVDAEPTPVAFEAEEDVFGTEALTPREQDVLELLSLGLSNRRIAERLGISGHTVKFHVAAIYGKLGVSGRTAAVNRALRRGILKI